MDNTILTALRQCWTVPSCQNDIWLYSSFVYFYSQDALSVYFHYQDAFPGANS